MMENVYMDMSTSNKIHEIQTKFGGKPSPRSPKAHTSPMAHTPNADVYSLLFSAWKPPVTQRNNRSPSGHKHDLPHGKVELVDADSVRKNSAKNSTKKLQYCEVELVDAESDPAHNSSVKNHTKKHKNGECINSLNSIHDNFVQNKTTATYKDTNNMQSNSNYVNKTRKGKYHRSRETDFDLLASGEKQVKNSDRQTVLTNDQSSTKYGQTSVPENCNKNTSNNNKSLSKTLTTLTEDGTELSSGTLKHDATIQNNHEHPISRDKQDDTEKIGKKLCRNYTDMIVHELGNNSEIANKQLKISGLQLKHVIPPTKNDPNNALATSQFVFSDTSEFSAITGDGSTKSDVYVQASRQFADIRRGRSVRLRDKLSDCEDMCETMSRLRAMTDMRRYRHKMCQKWLVHEDGALAYHMQNKEIDQHLGLNRVRNRTVREDMPVARTAHQEEEVRLQEERMRQIEELSRQAAEDEQVAKEMAEKLEMEDAQRTAVIATTDEEYARQMQEREQRRFERKRQERHLERERQHIEERLMRQSEDARIAAGTHDSGSQSGGDTSFNSADQEVASPRDSSTRVTPGGAIEDEGDFSDFYLQPSVTMEPNQRRQLQQVQDEELARLLQEQEHKRTKAEVNRGKLRDIEKGDEELAKVMQEQEKLRLIRARQRKHRSARDGHRSRDQRHVRPNSRELTAIMTQEQLLNSHGQGRPTPPSPLRPEDDIILPRQKSGGRMDRNTPQTRASVNTTQIPRPVNSQRARPTDVRNRSAGSDDSNTQLNRSFDNNSQGNRSFDNIPHVNRSSDNQAQRNRQTDAQRNRSVERVSERNAQRNWSTERYTNESYEMVLEPFPLENQRLSDNVESRIQPTDRQPARQPDRHISGQLDRHTERLPDRQTDRQPDRQTDRQPDRHISGQPERHTDRQPVDRQPDRQSNRQSERSRLQDVNMNHTHNAPDPSNTSNNHKPPSEPLNMSHDHRLPPDSLNTSHDRRPEQHISPTTKSVARAIPFDNSVNHRTETPISQSNPQAFNIAMAIDPTYHRRQHEINTTSPVEPPAVISHSYQHSELEWDPSVRGSLRRQRAYVHPEVNSHREAETPTPVDEMGDFDDSIWQPVQGQRRTTLERGRSNHKKSQASTKGKKSGCKQQ